jgi:hypothetical protein
VADIKVTDLTINTLSGTDLFEDSESFMMEISDEQVLGGLSRPTVLCVADEWGVTCVVTGCGRRTHIVYNH